MKTFHQSRYSAEEIKSLTKSLIIIYDDFNLNDAFIQEVIPVIKEKNTELTQLLLNSKNSEVNQVLSEADQNRDSAFIAFRDYCKIFESYFIPYKANSAREICSAIREIGWDIYQKGYSEENLKVNQLIEKLESPDFTVHLKTIDAEPLLAELKKTQEEFDKLYSKEVSSYSYSNYPNIRIKKKDVAELIQLLFLYTKFKAKYDKRGYEELSLKIFSLIDESTQAPKKIIE